MSPVSSEREGVAMAPGSLISLRPEALQCDRDCLEMEVCPLGNGEAQGRSCQPKLPVTPMANRTNFLELEVLTS